MSHAEDLKILERVRNRVKKHPVIQEMFDEYGISLDEIDLIPMAFADLDVSARTAHGILYFNRKLREDDGFENDDHYMVHEITHWLQQTTGDKPSKGAGHGNYLDNEDEIEGFQNQVEFLSDTRGNGEPEKYVNQVLDHHAVNEKNERKERRDELMEAVAEKSVFNQLLLLAK